MNDLYDIFGPKVSPKPPPLFDQVNPKTIEFDWDRGGSNNIIMAVEVMVCLAQMFNRSLIIPEAAKWYLLNGNTHLFDFYDEETFKSFVPTSSTKRKGVVWNAKGEFVDSDGKLDIAEIEKHQDADHWIFSTDARMFTYFPLAFLEREDFYSIIKSSLRLKSELISESIDLLNKNNLRIGEYVALHVRRNDFQYKKIATRSNKDIVEYVLKDDNQNMPILILSDVFDQKLVEMFESNGNRVVCWSQKEHDSEIIKGQSYFGTNSKESIVLDMLCATPAMRFYGSHLSTLSSRFFHWRGLLSRCNPKIDDNAYFTMPRDLPPCYWSRVYTSYWK